MRDWLNLWATAAAILMIFVFASLFKNTETVSITGRDNTNNRKIDLEFQREIEVSPPRRIMAGWGIVFSAVAFFVFLAINGKLSTYKNAEGIYYLDSKWARWYYISWGIACAFFVGGVYMNQNKDEYDESMQKTGIVFIIFAIIAVIIMTVLLFTLPEKMGYIYFVE